MVNRGLSTTQLLKMKGKAQISPFVTLNSGMFVIYLQQKGGINPNRSAVQKQIEGFRKKGYLDRRDDGSWHVLAMNSRVE